jgi:hypothetical protein
VQSEYILTVFYLVRPGVGKTTVMREIARVLADEFQKRVVYKQCYCLLVFGLYLRMYNSNMFYGHADV